MSLVFITGATGFIGSQVVAATLKAGYRVRLSVRRAEQEQSVKERYTELTSQVETVVIPNITKAECFDDALRDVDYVFHLASPMPGKGSDVRTDYVEPAVQGTEGILYAGLKYPQIRKIFVVSSVLALVPVDALLSRDVSVKDNTNETIPVNLDMPFPDGFAGHGLKYSASKILAHQATRQFLQSKKPHYTILTFHPTFVLGDSLIQQSAQDIGGMNALFWSSLFSEKPKISTAWVHVRDVAEAHVKALTSTAESGTEFLMSSSTYPWEEAVNYIKKEYPALGCTLEAPYEREWKIDTTTAEEILGMKWRSKKVIIDDVVKQQLALKDAQI